MALSTVTINFDLSQLLGADFDSRRTKAYVTTNVENATLMDTSTGETRMGDQAVTVASDGTGSFTTWGIGTDGNPISWQTSLIVDYPRTGQRDRKHRTFGPYTITDADDGKNITDLEDEQAIPPNYQTAFTASMVAIRDETEELRDEAAALIVSDLGTTDGQTAFLLANPSQSKSVLDETIEGAIEAEVPGAVAEELADNPAILDTAVALAAAGVGLLTAAKAPEFTRNRVPNPQLKGGAPQNPASSQLLQSEITTGLPTGASYGVKSIRQGSLSTVVALMEAGAVAGANAQAIPVTPGEYISARADLWSNDPGTLFSRITLRFYDASDTFLSAVDTSSAQPATASTWQTRKADNALVPTNATHVVIRGSINTSGTATAAAESRMTNVMVVSASTAPATYADGNTALWAWLGAPFASASIQVFRTNAESATLTSLAAQSTAILAEVGAAAALQAALASQTSVARRSLADIRDGVGLLFPGQYAARRRNGTMQRAESSSVKVTCKGDSITYGTGDEAALGGFPGRIATLLPSLTVTNLGYAGRASSDIALYAGDIVPLVTLTANKVPAGSVAEVPVTAILPTTSWRFGDGSNYDFTGYLLLADGTTKVNGTLRHKSGSTSSSAGWAFVPSSAPGADIAIAPETRFVCTANDGHEDDTTIYFAGHNNGGTYGDVHRDIAIGIGHQAPSRPRYLVLSILTGTAQGSSTGSYAARMAENANLAAIYGDRYLDLRRYLIDHGLTDAGITPTTNDLIDIAADTIPRSLLSDTIHPNAAGYTVIAAYLAKALTDRGWAKVPGLLAEDTFDRDDQILSMASDGSTWTQSGGGGFEVISNAMGHQTATTRIQAVLDGGSTTRRVRYEMTGAFAATFVFVTRYTSGSDHVFIDFNGTSNAPRLWYRIGGSSGSVIATGTAGAWAPGDVIELVTTPTHLELFKNGVSVLSVASTQHAAYTKDGIAVDTNSHAARVAKIQIWAS